MNVKPQDDYTSAALYARVSNDRQDVDLSVAAQLRALRGFGRAVASVWEATLRPRIAPGRSNGWTQRHRSVFDSADTERSKGPFGIRSFLQAK